MIYDEETYNAKGPFVSVLVYHWCKAVCYSKGDDVLAPDDHHQRRACEVGLISFPLLHQQDGGEISYLDSLAKLQQQTLSTE